jgi:acetate kinase
MRDLLGSGHARAAEAVELFTFRISREVAALANTLGGLECLVFTGGVGQHAKEVREMVCERLGWLGIELSSHASGDASRISTADSRVEVRVIETNEELMIARHTRDLIAKS